MTDKEIVSMYFSIPFHDREKLKREIFSDKRKKKRNSIGHYIEAMQELTGIDILDKCRKRLYIDSRACISYILNKNGVSMQMIGEAIGKDHSTVFKYIDDTEFYLAHKINNSRTELLSKYKKKLSSCH